MATRIDQDTLGHVVISSLVVETAPGTTQEAADALALIRYVEVHEINGPRIVVTIEAPTLDASHATASSFLDVPGVLNINLVYCNFEDDPTLNTGE